MKSEVEAVFRTADWMSSI